MKTKTIKTPDVEWEYQNHTITSIDQMPEDAIGFVYIIKFVDGTLYVGKKNVYKFNTVKAKKDGTPREGAIKQIQRNTGKGYRQTYDIIQSESDWRTYQGSHKSCKIRKPVSKTIIEYAFSQKQLTYLEAKYLFTYDVLESNQYLNDNILGSFFRGDIH